MSEKGLTIQNKQGDLSREVTRAAGHYLKPTVDIFESEEGLTLVADMPGLAEQDLEINIDQGVLTIQGHSASLDKKPGLYREFDMASYHRQFQLPDLIDVEKTSAELKHGVLTLNLPKAESAKPRRIEVKSVH